MAKILSIIKLCLDLGAVALEMLKAAIRLYHQYKASMEYDVTQETVLA